MFKSSFYGIEINVDKDSGYYSFDKIDKYIDDDLLKRFNEYEKLINIKCLKIIDDIKFINPLMFHFVAERYNDNYALYVANKMKLENDDLNKDNEEKTNKETTDEIKQDDNIIEEQQAITLKVDKNEKPNKESFKETFKEIKQNKIKENSTLSSYSLGDIGEKHILNLIKDCKPEYETKIVSSTGHIGDIHIIDKYNSVKYLIEVKDKETITKEDIIKFENDLNLIKNKEKLTYKNIYGLFISLESEYITSIGRYKIDKDKIYLSKSMINKETLLIIFSMMETFINLNEMTLNKVDYNIPVKVYELISQLRIEYNNINNEEEFINNIIKNNENSIMDAKRLQRNNEIKKEFIKFINNEFVDVLPIINDKVENKDEQRLIEYMNNNKVKDIKKKEIIKLFPSYITEIGNIGLKEFINKYKTNKK